MKRRNFLKGVILITGGSSVVKALAGVVSSKTSVSVIGRTDRHGVTKKLLPYQDELTSFNTNVHSVLNNKPIIRKDFIDHFLDDLPKRISIDDLKKLKMATELCCYKPLKLSGK